MHWTPQQSGLMYNMLADLTAEQFLKGVKIFCLKHKEIYPNTNIIAYIREYAFIDQNRLSAAEAWGEVICQVESIGYYGKPVFSTPIIEKAVKCVGWRNICMSENIGVERAHFMRAYESLIDRENFTATARERRG